MLIRTIPHEMRRDRGFTLVEMMVAMALGLIVIAAVLAFIFSLIRANSSTVLDTRLNQELRATMAVIAGEVTRARAIQDPIAAVGHGAGGIDYNNDGVVDAADATVPQVLLENHNGSAVPNCVRYAYHDGASLVFRAVYLGSDGRVGIVSGSSQAAATCGGGSPLNTADGVRITGLEFAFDESTNKRHFSIVLSGELASPPAYMQQNAALGLKEKTLRQVVSIRSNDA
jgi:prepilin-type N-terminal cleavage/methylation domain-containing protein